MKEDDLPVGYEVELLTVIQRVENKEGRSNYLCKCSCGNITYALGKQLKAAKEERLGSKKSCGCLIPMICRTHALSDEKCLVGKKFGRLIVLIRDWAKYTIDGHSSYYLCKCECGSQKVVSRTHLIAGSVKSCGCFKKEAIERFVKKYSVKKTYTRESLKKCSLCKKEKKCKEFFKQLHKFTSRCKECSKKNIGVKSLI